MPMLIAVALASSAIGVFGLALSLFRWVSASRGARVAVVTVPQASGAADFATVGQWGSFACTSAVLLIISIAAPVVLFLHWTGPRGGPSQDVAATLVAALALIVITALVIPTIATQIAWTWRRRTPTAEAAVLARAVPGRRRLIVAARVVATIAWTISTASACVISGLLIGAAAEQARAVSAAYSRYDAAEAVRSELLEQYVVGDVRCPRTLRDPARNSTFRCRVTSLSRSDTIAASWEPSGYGTGTVHVVAPQDAALTRTSDLGERVPEAVSPDRLISATAMTQQVRTQMRSEGWSRTSRASRDLVCPGVGAGYGPGFVRCTIGKDPETQRWLDVYPVADDRVVARTAEIADLPR